MNSSAAAGHGIELGLLRFSSPHDPKNLGRLGSYEVVRLLGQGGMGFVFLASDDGLRRLVALKVMRPEIAARPIARERFLREGRAAAAIRSDRVVTVFQVGEADGVPYLALELLEGCSLDAWLTSHPGPVHPDRIAAVACDVLAGLSAAHAKGLVHRDIKPANLWVESPTDRVKILDFGLTRPESDDSPLTHEGGILGTPAYMAPEQAEGKAVDARCDLWSLGVVLYRMATGSNPFQRNTTYATLAALATDLPPAATTIPGLPPHLAVLIDRLMSKDPSGRPESAEAAITLLSQSGESGADSSPDRTNPRPRKHARRSRRLLVTAALVGIASAVGLSIVAISMWWPSGSSVGTGVEVTAGTMVREFNIRRFAPPADGGAVTDRGYFGRDTFYADQGDLLTLDVRLTEPAYTYLIAFRPDGVAELCYPASENLPPTKRDRATHPENSSRGSGYGLREGTGLWVFAAVVSQEPLPAFSDWLRTHRLPVRKGPVSPRATVLVSHGGEVEIQTVLNPAPGARTPEFINVGEMPGALPHAAGNEKLPGMADFIELVDGLKAASPLVEIKALGLCVDPQRPGSRIPSKK
jgi:serine/threonine protein kinase